MFTNCLDESDVFLGGKTHHNLHMLQKIAEPGHTCICMPAPSAEALFHLSYAGYMRLILDLLIWALASKWMT